MYGIIVLLIYALVMLAATALLTKRETGAENFHAAGRRTGTFQSAISIVATQTWTPTSTENANAI